MKNMKIEECLFHAKNISNIATDDYQIQKEVTWLITYFEDELRTKANKQAGKSNVEKCAKAILKNAEKEAAKYFWKAHIIDEKQYFCDGLRILKLDSPIEIDNYILDPLEKDFDFTKFFEYSKDNKIDFDTAKYKAEYKIFKAEHKGQKFIYSFGKGLPKVNATYLNDFCNLGDIKEIYYSGITAPVASKVNDAEFILLPVNVQSVSSLDVGFKVIG